MNKKCLFFIDDVIWVLRDLTRQKPKSLFDNEFMAMLKEAHDKYGMKVQLHIFYRTDFYYGEDEFSLADMTDAYKSEFEEASDWLKFSFHAKQEFPDYPYVNADYETVKINLDRTKKEVFRFAGENSYSYGTVTHWLPVSKEGVKALRDGGMRVINPSHGEKAEYTGDVECLPYGHAFRLLQNRKPEAMLYTRESRNVAISNSVCSYNHITSEEADETMFNLKAIYDKETDMYYKLSCNSVCLNLNTVENLVTDLEPVLGKEFIGYATHEQYFYEDYFAYQPDYAEKLLLTAKILSENGYEYIFIEDFVDYQ